MPKRSSPIFGLLLVLSAIITIIAMVVCIVMWRAGW